MNNLDKEIDFVIDPLDIGLAKIQYNPNQEIIEYIKSKSFFINCKNFVYSITK